MKASEREKAVLFALAAGYIDSWKEAFILAAQKPEKEVTAQKNITTSAERWKRRPDILKAYETARAAVEELRGDTRPANDEGGNDNSNQEKRAGDSNRTQGRRAAAVDYYDPQNQRRTINAIIDRSQDDPKTQLDAIKAIQQTQRDDRQAAKDNQIQRFYTPVTCKICPLYQKRIKKG